MTKVTSLLATLLLVVLISSSTAQPQFGTLIYSGQSSADIYLGRLTDPNYSKVEFYRGAKLLGTITQNGPDGGIVTDYGLGFGNSYNYNFRAYITTGGYVDGMVKNGFIIGGDIRGHLTRKDTVSRKTDLLDSLYILPGGEFFFVLPNGDISVVPGLKIPGGELHLAPGADLSYNVAFSGKISGIRIFNSLSPSDPPGKFTGSGGKLNDVNIECYGQVGPVKNVTFVASDIKLWTDYPSDIENCTLDFTKSQGRNDYAFIWSPHFKVIAKACTLRNESQILGASLADRCVVEYDGILSACVATNCEFRSNGQLLLRPSGVPTSCRFSKFGFNSSISLSNMSVVEFNVFEPTCIVTISPIAAGFDPSDVKNIHINYNEFQREGSSAALLSIVGADTIDATLNYWGQCNGPTTSERLGRRAHFDPFLRVKYPGTSYWFDVSPNKTSIIANDEDEVTFTGHFFNVLTRADSAGATVNYLVRILGEELLKGTLTADANGMVSLTFKVPMKYKNAIAMEVYFTSIQCIDQAFIITVKQAQGADLEILDAKVIQVMDGANAIIANKPFAVKAEITTSEPVSSKFKFHVRANNVVYDTFYVLNKTNLGIQYQLENPLTEISLPSGETIFLIIPIQNKAINTGMALITAIIDPPDSANPKGRIIESNDNNNTYSFDVKVNAASYGNEGAPNFDVFLQPIEKFPFNQVDRITRWADTTRNFMENAWPMKEGQVSFTNAGKIVDYSWIYPDTLLQESWEYYLMKAYKQMRIANPAYDRYVFAVEREWFGKRLHPENFAHRHSQMVSWSGIYDFMVTTAESYKYLTHSLGHSFGLRRHDFDDQDENMMEEYYNFFIGKEINGGFDFNNLRVIDFGLLNKIARIQKAYCFMGNIKMSNPEYTFTTWICDVDYNKLLGAFSSFTGQNPTLSKGLAAQAILIEGSVDSTTRAFSFGPWIKLDNAKISPMMDPTYATHIFKLLDASDQELARYYYRPTFTALGMDEAAESPRMETEYFAFVAPYTSNVKKVVVEKDGNVVAQRVLSNNPPKVQINYPTDGIEVDMNTFTALWNATDPDGDTEFWYTVYLSSDGGNTWKVILFEKKDELQAIINASQGVYKLKVIASDGLNSSEEIVTFTVTQVSTDLLATPGEFLLHQNYPNPFNPSTVLSYSLPKATYVTLEVYDALGRIVETLYTGYQPAGKYTAEFNAENRPSGTYIAVLRSSESTSTIRMVLSK